VVVDYAAIATGGFVDFDWFRIDLPTLTEVVPEEGLHHNNIPHNFFLGQNYPNPFNPATKIRYEIPNMCYMTLKMYNFLGQEVATLFEGIHQPGNYETIFDGSKIASGAYLYQMKAEKFVDEKKLILSK
jgi:hypothetical protein